MTAKTVSFLVVTQYTEGILYTFNPFRLLLNIVLMLSSYIHRRHILYRDLKPENVLIDKDGYTTIVDLGFAKIVRDKTFTLCGTPWYIAPEVILGSGVYSFSLLAAL